MKAQNFLTALPENTSCTWLFLPGTRHCWGQTQASQQPPSLSCPKGTSGSRNPQLSVALNGQVLQDLNPGHVWVSEFKVVPTLNTQNESKEGVAFLREHLLQVKLSLPALTQTPVERNCHYTVPHFACVMRVSGVARHRGTHLQSQLSGRPRQEDDKSESRLAT